MIKMGVPWNACEELSLCLSRMLLINKAFNRFSNVGFGCYAFAYGYHIRIGAMVLACLCAPVLSVARQSAAQKAPVPADAPAPTAGAKAFDTPQQAAEALIGAAGKFDQAALIQIFGPGGEDIVFSGELPQDREHATDFATQAREKESVSVDPKTGSRAFVIVGDE